MEHEGLDGTAVHALDQVSQKLLLRAVFRLPRAIDLGAHRVVTLDEPFVGHDLHGLEDRRVACWLGPIEDRLQIFVKVNEGFRH